MEKQFKKEDLRTMTEMYEKKIMSLKEISEHYNVDSSVIKKGLEKMGVNIINGSPFSVKYWMGRGLSEEKAKYKIKTIKPIYPEYWINRGFNNEEAEIKAKHSGNRTLESCIYNNGEVEGKKIWDEKLRKNSENNKLKSKRRVEYWLGEGFTMIEAEKMVSEQQKTFTKDICIKKYGKKKGLKIWEERNSKWSNKMESIRKNKGFNNDSKSVDFFKKKYGDTWLEEMVKQQSKTKNGELIKGIIENCSDIDSFRGYVRKNKSLFTTEKIIATINNALVKEIFKLKPAEIRSHINEMLVGNTKGVYGYIIRHNGKTFKSRGEFDISVFLENENIDYIYEKNYPNTNKKTDFYLPKLNVYIEYTGMENLSDGRDDYKKVLKSYKNRMKEKMGLCLKHGLKCVFLNKVNDVKKYINEKKNNDKRSR